MTIGEMNSYPSLVELLSPSKPTYDDSDNDGHAVTLDTIRRQQTLDQDWFDSIGTY